MVTYGLEVGQGLTGRAVVDHLSHGEHHQAVKQAVDRIAGLVDGEYNGATLHSQPEQNKRKCVIFRSCHVTYKQDYRMHDIFENTASSGKTKLW